MNGKPATDIPFERLSGSARKLAALVSSIFPLRPMFDRTRLGMKPAEMIFVVITETVRIIVRPSSYEEAL